MTLPWKYHGLFCGAMESPWTRSRQCQGNIMAMRWCPSWHAMKERAGKNHCISTDIHGTHMTLPRSTMATVCGGPRNAMKCHDVPWRAVGMHCRLPGIATSTPWQPVGRNTTARDENDIAMSSHLPQHHHGTGMFEHEGACSFTIYNCHIMLGNCYGVPWHHGNSCYVP